MKDFYYDYFENEENEEDFFDEDKSDDFQNEENYPSAEEYNRIRKQKYNY